MPEDLIDMGFIEDEDGNYIYTEDDDPFDFGFNWFISNEKNYPNFDPIRDIPWSTFPQYIKDILYMNTDDLSAAAGEPFKVPFVSVVVVSATTCQLFVGVNVGWGQLNDSSLSFGIWSLPGISDISAHSCLYRLSWSYANNYVVADWIDYKPTAFGNKGNLNRVLNYYFTDASNVDIYGYGANGVQYPSKSTSFSVLYNSSNTNLSCSFYTRKNGFQSGEFLHGQVNAYPYCYFEHFVPPSQESINQQLQQEQNETSKGIWETLKGIPEAIGEKIKGLFVPSEGFFDTYQQEFQTYFKERFGILYEIPELVISLMQKFITFNPKEDDYSITFPEVKLPVLEDGEWREEKLIEAQEFSFDFISEAPFSLLYDAYVAFIWLVYILLLVNLIKYKANSVFKGG